MKKYELLEIELMNVNADVITTSGETLVEEDYDSTNGDIHW